ncbi:triose-phosphate isomerase [Kocuria sp. WRN011]|uniref:Triosephosphate isomerase n=2 Tax=Bacteria TaxID=2 RepID=A0ABV3UYY4_9MICC|nr:MULTISPECIES: triose-phosphate isomerase [Kocuria]MCT1802396.1 triose-phosphate isomerase [Kocuria carniphila]PBB07808.1 triose-phosphate isomerase [Kocuria sp. WRN011]PZP30841.1 MAG: triose-phosphate isomerase [Kocuria rhizophila]
MTSKTDGNFDRTPLIAGNWKMNMDHAQGIALLQKLAWTLKDAKHDFQRVEVAVFPPFTDLRSVQSLVEGDGLQIVYGAQDLSDQDSGAYTGDISGEFLAKLDCTYALVGHSERRTVHHESDEQCRDKIRAAIRHKLTPMLCIGEGLDERQSGNHVTFTLEQLRGSLADLNEKELEGLVVAYEPVWAIGTGEVAGPEDAQEMAAAIREELGKLYSEDFAQATRILYGGSVKSSNVANILGGSDVDGALVGGASLDAEEFAKIARFEQHLLSN